MEGKSKVAHHGFTHTHIEHHPDGSHTVHHVHHEGQHKDVKHAAMNLDHVHDSLQDNLGTPNPGEAEANAGIHGVPAEHAEPAGLPVPGGTMPPTPAGPAGA
jgi:hypothetical protein